MLVLVAPVSVDISFNFGVMSQVSWTRAGTWHSAHPQYGGHSGKQRTMRTPYHHMLRLKNHFHPEKEVRSYNCHKRAPFLHSWPKHRGEKTSGIKNWKTWKNYLSFSTLPYRIFGKVGGGDIGSIPIVTSDYIIKAQTVCVPSRHPDPDSLWSHCKLMDTWLKQNFDTFTIITNIWTHGL